MSSIATQKVKLEYFNIAGVAERVRLALAIGGVDFEDVRIAFPDWSARKATAKFGQLPIMTLPDGREIYQSDAMLRWAGAHSSLYPSNSDLRLRIDEALGLAADLTREWRPCIYVGMKPEMFGHTADTKDAVVKTLRENFIKDALGRYLGFITDMIKTNGGKFVAGELSIADLDLFVSVTYFTKGIADHVPKDCLDNFPEILAWIEAVKTEPRFAAYYASKA